LELQWLLDGKIGGLGALDDLVDETGRLFAELVGVGGIGGQATALDEEPNMEHCWHQRSRRELENEPRNVRPEEAKRNDTVGVTSAECHHRCARLLFAPERSLHERETEPPGGLTMHRH